jgi:TolB protein
MRSIKLLPIVLIVVMVLTLGLMISTPAAAVKGSYPGVNGKIAFSSRVNNFWAIFIMNADGTNIQQLTDGTKYDVSPCWSPDGTEIAFARAVQGFADQTIWVMNSDGSGLRQLTSGGYQTAPAWSPDGTKIMFDREESGSNDGIYVIDANGPAGPGTLLFAGGFGPSWSPDGTRIVFVSSTLAITVADANTWTVIATLATGVSPCWSPDGSKIVFSNTIGVISVMNADGSGMTSLNVNGDEPNWSPDGTKIVFMAGGASVLIMNADGSEVHDLTPTMPDAGGPDWQRLPAAVPVGGFVEPVNRVAVLLPWLTIVGSVAAISVVIVASWKKAEN